MGNILKRPLVCFGVFSTFLTIKYILRRVQHNHTGIHWTHVDVCVSAPDDLLSLFCQFSLHIN